jgi:hypothetical protein
MSEVPKRSSWLRRRDPVLDRHLRTFLFTDGSIVAEEQEAEHGAAGEAASVAVRDRSASGA